MVRVVENTFGIAVDPLTQITTRVRRFTFSTEAGLSVSVLTLGATVQSVNVPDSYGKIDDVCLGFDDVAGYYANQSHYLGTTIGRVANRIAKGRFKLCGQNVNVSRNYNDEYHLHGGFIGFDSVLWDVIGVHKDGVTMQHVSPDGHEGYPGQLTVNINFSLEENGCFGVRIEARTTATTCVNIGNHAYFNLAGHGAGKSALYQHLVLIKADKIVETDMAHIPNGRLRPIKNTPYDFSHMTKLGRRIQQLMICPIGGFDNNYCVDVAPNRISMVARVMDPCCGRFLEIHTNQPGVQFTTTNDLPEKPPVLGKGGAKYAPHGAFSLQTQKYPDAMNHSNFPTIVLNPGQLYEHQLIYRFGCCPKRN